MIKIFKSHDAANTILEEILLNEIAGISGGRIETRKKLIEISNLAATNNHSNIFTATTYDHPDTELAYPHNSSCYSIEEAKELVISVYNGLTA